LSRSESITLVAAVVGTVLAAGLTYANASAVAVFVVTALALAAQASLVGDATEQLGARLGPGATGVLQSALGNLPELMIGIFSLRAGLVAVIQAALIGSILGNTLLVLGLAFLVGGLKNGTQRFAGEPVRMIATLTLLSVAALGIPTLAAAIHAPASAHAADLSGVTAVVLLIVFVASIPSSLEGSPTGVSGPGPEEEEKPWPLALAVVLLVLAAVGAAFVSDWFVASLRPAIAALHLSETFTGLVVVAIAGNAVENVVGVQLAARGKPDYAISVILNSPLQVALGLIPALVLLSFLPGLTPLTLVLPPLLLVSLWFAAVITAVIVFDGEYVWLEGVALIALYVMIAAAFWWG
jgi:Ca2+:H+ antiporter